MKKTKYSGIEKYIAITQTDSQIQIMSYLLLPFYLSLSLLSSSFFLFCSLPFSLFLSPSLILIQKILREKYSLKVLFNIILDFFSSIELKTKTVSTSLVHELKVKKEILLALSLSFQPSPSMKTNHINFFPFLRKEGIEEREREERD